MVHDWNSKRLSLHGVLRGLVEGALGQTDGAGCDWRPSLKNKKNPKLPEWRLLNEEDLFLHNIQSILRRPKKTHKAKSTKPNVTFL